MTGNEPVNRLLAALKPRDLALLAPALETVHLKPRTMLFEAGDNVELVHFPTPGVLGALVLNLSDGAAAETALIGQEGALGGIISEGRKPAFTRGIIQIGGRVQRLPARVLDAAKSRSPSLRDHFARYADCLLAQVLQSVACNAVHDFDARLARWLLTIQDRLGTADLPVTQEFIAETLGVRRSYTTGIIGTLRKSGMIRTSRGVITIVNRRKLEQQACECYGYLRRHFERLLPGIYPA